MSVQREDIIFTEDESKKQDSSAAFEGGHSINDLSEYEDGHFSINQGSIKQTPSALLAVPLVNTYLSFTSFLSIFMFLTFVFLRSLLGLLFILR